MAGAIARYVDCVSHLFDLGCYLPCDRRADWFVYWVGSQSESGTMGKRDRRSCVAGGSSLRHLAMDADLVSGDPGYCSRRWPLSCISSTEQVPNKGKPLENFRDLFSDGFAGRCDQYDSSIVNALVGIVVWLG